MQGGQEEWVWEDIASPGNDEFFQTRTINIPKDIEEDITIDLLFRVKPWSDNDPTYYTTIND
jgi:hypothetical protein